MSNPLIFISYSHEDVEWMKLLVKQLAVLQQQGSLKFFTDRDIVAGEDWYEKIQGALADAFVAILLVSADSLTSDFINKEEVACLLDQRAKKGLQIIPVIIKECPWEGVDWLARMEVRPRGVRPLPNKGARAQKEFKEIALELAKKLKSSRGLTPPVGSEGPGERQDRAGQELSQRPAGADPQKEFEQLRQQLDAVASRDPELARTLYEVGRKHMSRGQPTSGLSAYYQEDLPRESPGGSRKTTRGSDR
jgi:hypothetical protein